MITRLLVSLQGSRLRRLIGMSHSFSSLSLCLSVSLCLALSLSLYISVSLSLCLSVSLSLSLSPSLRVPLIRPHFLPVWLCLCEAITLKSYIGFSVSKQTQRIGRNEESTSSEVAGSGLLRRPRLWSLRNRDRLTLKLTRRPSSEWSNAHLTLKA